MERLTVRRRTSRRTSPTSTPSVKTSKARTTALMPTGAAPAGTSVESYTEYHWKTRRTPCLSTLQQHNPNVPILSTRRLGATGSIQVLFDGSLIPFWLAYDGAQRRCTPFRHRREACTNCWSTGHRRDVCPNPATSRCITCGLEHPEPGHACTPKCIVCHEEHPTGHPSCSQRFQKRRRLPGQQETGQKAKFRNLTSTVDTGQQERTLGLETSPTPFPSTLRAPSPAYNSTLKPATQTPLFPTRDRSRSRSRSRSQSRSRSRSRSSAISQQEARASSDGNGSPKGQQASSLGDLGSNQQRRTHKVSWAEAARAAPPKHTPTPLPSPSNSSYQIELASLREENRRQREEIAWLKGMVRQLTPSNTSTALLEKRGPKGGVRAPLATSSSAANTKNAVLPGEVAAKGQQGGMYYLPEGAPVLHCQSLGAAIGCGRRKRSACPAEECPRLRRRRARHDGITLFLLERSTEASRAGTFFIVTKSAALTSVEDPSRVHRMQVRKCSARSAVGVGYDRQGRQPPSSLDKGLADMLARLKASSPQLFPVYVCAVDEGGKRRFGEPGGKTPFESGVAYV
ncbi:hypothetical protein HPB47_004935 [Ixodes persulcatus]|uniref:Uncharacterized protein n=1 Tax=Ixodes persulcatus TaxID=34615 RepID=A0AC60PEI4_IXOPE|nr:hypothetical protein HPB47_004935 [Ixodes persulcatus]